MSCCKRHGVQAFSKEPMPSLQACMDACGTVPACQSVDWHKDTGLCYYGKHSGEPTISVAGWSAAYSMGCAGACKKSTCACGQQDQSTGTGQACCGSSGPVEPAQDLPLPPPAQCGNQGLQWAQYPNNQGSNQDEFYSQFRPENYKSTSPATSGITSTVGGITTQGGQMVSVYGDTRQFSGDYFALSHKGYLFASVTGRYKFTVSNVDDTVFLWLGSSALKGWTRNNADLVVGLKKPATTEIDIPGGHYMPIRIMFVQAQGLAKFDMLIQGPKGETIADSTTQSSPWILQYSCDGSSAPAFSPWGQEE